MGRTKQVKLAGGPADDVPLCSFPENARAILREQFSPTWCVLHRAPPQESAGPGGPLCGDAPQSVPCVVVESRCRDPRDPLQIPPRCDAPKSRALLDHCGKLESCPSLRPLCPSVASLASSPAAIATDLVLIGHPSTDAEAHRRIEPTWRLRQPRTRNDERTFRIEVPRKRCPEHARQEFTPVQWSDHKPTLPDTPPRPAYACRSMPAVHGVHNVPCLNIPFCKVLKTGCRENQRPVNPDAEHTIMVCKQR